ncbi:unnamed protein product, partial [marine sediment metagenome]
TFADRSWAAVYLPTRKINGCCFNRWVYSDVPQMDGSHEDLLLAARYMPIYVSERGGLWSWDGLNQEDAIPTWPDEVEMLRVDTKEAT